MIRYGYSFTSASSELGKFETYKALSLVLTPDSVNLGIFSPELNNLSKYLLELQSSEIAGTNFFVIVPFRLVHLYLWLKLFITSLMFYFFNISLFCFLKISYLLILNILASHPETKQDTSFEVFYPISSHIFLDITS